jgi:hypothetical protein
MPSGVEKSRVRKSDQEDDPDGDGRGGRHFIYPLRLR